jgi:predicted RNA binding protein YcfA (HicA-like mRNA interferase family)
LTKLPRDIKGKDVIRALKKKGWGIVRTKGSHNQLGHDDENFTITVPCHPTPLKVKVLHNILVLAGLTIEEFIALL